MTKYSLTYYISLLDTLHSKRPRFDPFIFVLLATETEDFRQKLKTY